jgi:hypothetical protein
MNYLFPPTVFVQINTLGQQLDHALSEVDEIEATGPLLEAAEGDLAAHEAARRILEVEMFDLIHSLETWRRILVNERGQEYVDGLVREVVAKNSAPGREYYV